MKQKKKYANVQIAFANGCPTLRPSRRAYAAAGEEFKAEVDDFLTNDEQRVFTALVKYYGKCSLDAKVVVVRPDDPRAGTVG